LFVRRHRRRLQRSKRFFTSSIGALAKPLRPLCTPEPTLDASTATQGAAVPDVIFITIIAGFFAASVGLLRFCAALRASGERR